MASEHTELPASAGESRRSFLKKAGVAGAVAWTAPTVLSSPALAQGTCELCLLVSWTNAFWASTLLYANGASVPTWTACVGGLDATQTTATRQPTFLTTGLAGQPAVDFDGTDDLLQFGPLTLAQPFSIVVIGQQDTTTDANTAVRNNTGPGVNLTFRRQGGAFFSITAGTDLDDGASTTAPSIVVGYYNGTSSFIEVNGVQTTGNAGTNNLNNATMNIGAGLSGTSNPFDGRIAFVGFYSGNVTTDPNWAEFESCVTSIYGIPT